VLIFVKVLMEKIIVDTLVNQFIIWI